MRIHIPGRLIARALVALCVTAVIVPSAGVKPAEAAPLPCQLSMAALSASTGNFAQDVNGVVNSVIGVDTLGPFIAADATIRAMVPCNQAQADYQAAELDVLGWMAAGGACRTAFYYDAKTIADVNAWLGCITPVNNGIVLASSTANSLYLAALQATGCTGGFSPPTLVSPAGIPYAVAASITGATVKTFKAVKKAQKALTLGLTGFTLLTSYDADAARKLSVDVTVHFGTEALRGTAVATGRQLGTVVFPPLPSMTLPASDTVQVETTVTGPGVTRSTMTGSATLGTS